MAQTPMQSADRLLNAAQSKMRLATVRTLNRLADSVYSRAAVEISKDLRLRKMDVTPALRIKKGRATESTPWAEVQAIGMRIPLKAFLTPALDVQYIRQLIRTQQRAASLGRSAGGRFTGRGLGKLRGFGVGITYQIGNVRKTAANLFIAGLKSGHGAVFHRRGEKRLPIDERMGPSIPKSFINNRVQAALHSVIDSRMVKEMAANARFYAGKIGIGVDVN